MARILLAGWISIIMYGTLFPFNFANEPHDPDIFNILLAPLSQKIDVADILINFLLFMPSGYLAMKCFGAKIQHSQLLILITAFGFTLSLSVECAQALLPMRTPSLYDVILNTIGMGIGAIAARQKSQPRY